MIQIPGQGEVRPVRDSDYIDGKLPIGAFVRWETRETLDLLTPALVVELGITLNI